MLRNCPFCGSVPDLVHDFVNCWLFVHCDNCEAQGPEVYLSREIVDKEKYPSLEEAVAEVIEHWNERTETST